MSVKIGINPITWTNDDVPELGGDTPLETCLAETHAAGYLGTELGGKFPRQASALADVLSRHDLQLVSGWWDGRMLERDVDAEFDAVMPHLALLRDVGAGVVVYADTSHGRHDGIWQPISTAPASPTRTGRCMGASSPPSPSGWPISACAWHSITTWGRSSRATARSIA